MIRLVERRKPRSYYFADIYALDYRNKDKDIQERVKLVGKYLVSPTSMNDSYIELSTSKRMGSIDRNKLESMDLRNGFDYPNLFVDINSLVKATKEEIVTYVKSQDSTQNELNFIRNTVLNGCLPHNKFFIKLVLNI
ncbi:MAG: hypothetical protein IKP98_03950 [Bacilli bacterium]|nr:hypothetical protein [Bacilli bacterium]